MQSMCIFVEQQCELRVRIIMEIALRYSTEGLLRVSEILRVSNKLLVSKNMAL